MRRPDATALAAVLALALAACNAIAGLDGFVKVDAGEADVSPPTFDGGGGEERDAAAPEADVPDAAPREAGFADALRAWAQWPMPLDAAYVVDGGTVTDPVTRLVWSRATFPAADLDSASEACARVGMVLPTRIELVSLLDFRRRPLVDPAFADAGPERLWSASANRATDGGGVWTVDFASGVVRPDVATAVRCVREPR